MKYIVLARRYRPQFFRDVIGQDAIVTTLKNALRLKRVAHAYLFCGSRGTGKTTLARLFAKALNCHAPHSDLEPCNQCPSCLEILSGQSLDVIEIDGASNRGIDDIRQINETVGYAPSHGTYKIYMIDEVHMLTKEAFNALLKTLEEPPERVKFFFATTEPHKVLPTIISRCQRFDLQRLSEIHITTKLLAIARDLNRDTTQEALHLIASFAEGSLRDAESLFDQMLCFTDGPLLEHHVRECLGLIPDELFSSLDTAFAKDHLSFAFELVEQLFQMGKDLLHFTEQLIGHYRCLLQAKLLSVDSLHLPEKLKERVSASMQIYTSPQLFFILDLLLTSFGSMQKSPMPRVSLEALLLQILRSKQRIPLEVLIRRLSDLEQKLLETPATSPQISLPVAEPLKSIEAQHPSNLEKRDHVEEKPMPTKPDSSDSPPLELKPTPFNPFESISPQTTPKEPEQLSSFVGKPEASEEKNVEEKPMPTKTDPSDRLCTVYPGRHETLLRFAAIELEGTLKT